MALYENCRNPKNLVGRVFGDWTALRLTVPTTDTHYLCECTCGTLRTVEGFALVHKTSTHCGCRPEAPLRKRRSKLRRSVVLPVKPNPQHGFKAKDHRGTTHHRWTLLYRVTVAGQERRVFYQCRCACGTERAVLVDAILRGSSQSCGCLRKEQAPAPDIAPAPLTPTMALIRRELNQIDASLTTEDWAWMQHYRAKVLARQNKVQQFAHQTASRCTSSPARVAT